MKKIILIFIAFSICFYCNAQDYSININIAKPKVKAVDNKENLRNILFFTINESLAELSEFVTVVERENLELINKKKEAG